MTDEGIEKSASGLINNVECIFFLTVIDCSWSTISAQEVMFYTARFKGYILMYPVSCVLWTQWKCISKTSKFQVENFTDALNKMITKLFKRLFFLSIIGEYKRWLYVHFEKLNGNLHASPCLYCDSFESSKFLFYVESRNVKLGFLFWRTHINFYNIITKWMSESLSVYLREFKIYKA